MGGSHLLRPKIPPRQAMGGSQSSATYNPSPGRVALVATVALYRRSRQARPSRVHLRSQQVRPSRVHLRSRQARPSRVHLRSQQVRPSRVHLRSRQARPSRVHLRSQQVRPSRVHLRSQQVRPSRVHLRSQQRLSSIKGKGRGNSAALSFAFVHGEKAQPSASSAASTSSVVSMFV